MEHVWGLPRDRLFEHLPPFQGFVASSKDFESIARRLERAGSFRPRDEAESDPNWKQIIPYVVVTRAERVLLLERLTTQSETRLHHFLSVGVGGHVNPEPESTEPLVIRALRRELREELEVSGDHLPRLLGFLNDDSTEVGSVHFGLACQLEVDHDVGVRERDRMHGRWIRRTDLAHLAHRLESWSRILCDAGALSPEPKPKRTP